MLEMLRFQLKEKLKLRVSLEAELVKLKVPRRREAEVESK